MDNEKTHQLEALSLGSIEPHKPLLRSPPDGQRLYKVMRAEDLLSSISGAYLHFNRVDSYKDFEGADGHDSQQLPQDRKGNAAAVFSNAPNFSAADYYDQCRARTYACCFSLKNSDYIWREYGNGRDIGKVCVVFEFGKLRKMLNTTFKAGNSEIEYDTLRCNQILSINYGIVDYVEWATHRVNAIRLPNPIQYAHIKDKSRFSEDHELRISLSAIGMGHFVLDDGRTMPFPEHLQSSFDFRAAMANGTIIEILCAPDLDRNLFKSELLRLGIKTRPN